MFGQVEGRTAADVLARLATVGLDRRTGIGYVAIDMSATYRAAIRTSLPHATVVATTSTWSSSSTRRCPWSDAAPPPGAAAGADGRAPRSGKPDGDFRATARTSPTTSSPPCGTSSWAGGEIGQTLLTAWTAKENLPRPSRPGPQRSRPQPSRPRPLEVPHLVRGLRHPRNPSARTTVNRWWPGIATFVDTGHSNAKSEGINRVIKLVARNAFGFRSPTNQRYAHSVSPPAEPADTPAPLNFEDRQSGSRAPSPTRELGHATRTQSCHGRTLRAS
ncbi:transposase [Streptomyces sp. NPDC002143]